MYFADSGRRNIFRMSVTGGNHIPVGHTAAFVRPTAIAFDQLRNFLYWTDNNQFGRSYRHLSRLSLSDYEIKTLLLRSGEMYTSITSCTITVLTQGN